MCVKAVRSAKQTQCAEAAQSAEGSREGCKLKRPWRYTVGTPFVVTRSGFRKRPRFFRGSVFQFLKRSTLFCLDFSPGFEQAGQTDRTDRRTDGCSRPASAAAPGQPPRQRPAGLHGSVQPASTAAAAGLHGSLQPASTAASSRPPRQRPVSLRGSVQPAASTPASSQPPRQRPASVQPASTPASSQPPRPDSACLVTKMATENGHRK